MKGKRRSFTAEFKAQVAIEALKGQETLAQLSERFNVSPHECLGFDIVCPSISSKEDEDRTP